jgi:hypothetical protein
MNNTTKRFLNYLKQGGTRSFIINSIGLSHFHLNSFCALRLPVSAFSKQAVWKMEKPLSPIRLNLSLQKPNLIPLLPSNKELDVNLAAQKLNESLQRTLEILLWFDFLRNWKRDVLCEGQLQIFLHRLLVIQEPNVYYLQRHLIFRKLT